MSESRFNLFGDIIDNDGTRLFESDVTPALFVGWLSKQGGKDVEVNINSNGGSVAAGLAIANAIRAYPGNVRANVLGLAASMASVVACAADELSLGKGAFLMIHNPWAMTVGEAEDLRHEADVLDAMKESVMAFYLSKFDRTREELSALMDAETWIAAEAAGEYSLKAVPFAGEFEAAACLTRRAFAHAPDAAKALFVVRDGNAAQAPADGAAAPAAPAVDWEARYKGASKKISELQERLDKAALETVDYGKACADRDAALAALDRARTEFEAKISEVNSQLDAAKRDLDAAKADLSSASSRAESAERDLAAKGEQLERLQQAQSLLTGGVLSPASESFDERMSAARTPEEREALRAQKRAGKIN